MKLKIKPHSKNIFPLQGFLIKGKELKNWLFQLHQLKIDINTTQVYAIPDTTPNSIWGCFVATEQEITSDFKISSVQFCQSIQNKLFIPEFAILFPAINSSEIELLFAERTCILHPEFGLFELEKPIDWSEVIEISEPENTRIDAPLPSPFSPQVIRKIEVRALPPDELLKVMEDNLFPKKESFKDEPLSWNEKIKYKLLKSAFYKTKSGNDEERTEKSDWFKKLHEFMRPILPNDSKIFEKLEQDFEDLANRNSSELEKLMALFKNNPEEALKYAIPIDNEGTNRGGNAGTFTMSKRRDTFSLFGSGQNGGSNVVFHDDSMAKLQTQYMMTASNLIKEKNYEKAAFIYMKLLKNTSMAAKTLEDGELFPEAASVYLKYLQNKEKAASCYEKGRMTSDAITLYKELNMNEKVGDLYLSINNRQEGFAHYNFVVKDYESSHQYVKASLLLRNKMDDTHSAQEMLLSGWREQKDSFNCLNNYFKNIEDVPKLSKAINQIYKNDTNAKNKEDFLKALKYEHKKDDLIASQTKEIAYEIISDLAKDNPILINELPAFNKDQKLAKDITRFKSKGL